MRPSRKSKSWVLLAGLIALGLAVLQNAHAQVPGIISYQGKLTVNGTNCTGTAAFKFALLSPQAGGSVTLWSHNGTSVAGGEPSGAAVSLPVNRGIYSVNLGDTNIVHMTQPIPASAFQYPEVYLRVWVNDGVNGSQKLVPDHRITAVGYALVARTTEEAPTYAINFSGTLAGDVTGPQTATVVSSVGGVSAANVAAGANAANAATSASAPGTLVRRNGADGGLSAGTVTATRFVGDGSGLTNLPAVPLVPASGTMLVSSSAQDASLVASGFRLITTVPAPSWVAGATSGAPSARFGHTAIWDGQEMIVWGGCIGGTTYSASGSLYRPDADTWSAVSSIGAPTARSGHTAVWSGSEMIVWGGYSAGGQSLGTGGRFSASTLTWSTVAASGAPAVRYGHVAVWTGSRMLVWGGMGDGGLLNDGALYDPVSNQWTAISLPNPPAARMHAAAVWGGDRLIVWGGEGSSDGGETVYEINTGAQLLFTNGVPTAWSALSATQAPLPRIGHSAVWAGGEMIIWGGRSSGSPLNDGASYRVSTDTWQPLTSTNAPTARYDHSAVWNGSEMLIVGGAVSASATLATGAAYDPGTRLWRPLSTAGNPQARSQAAAVWSGTEILIFGGWSGTQPVATLQRLSPQPTWYYYRKL